MSNTESSHCSVGHEIITDQLDGQDRCHLHVDERKKMETAGRSICRYHKHRHVHFQDHRSSESEEKTLDSTDSSQDDYTIDLPKRPPYMAYLKRNMSINLDTVEKMATNMTKLMTVVGRLQDKVDDLTEMQAIKGRDCGLSCTNNSLTL